MSVVGILGQSGGGASRGGTFAFTYTGKFLDMRDENGVGEILFITSGTITVTVGGKCHLSILGGGGGGGGSGSGNTSYYGSGGGGGGSGFATMLDDYIIASGSYTITLGSGGAYGTKGIFVDSGNPGGNGGTTTAFNNTAVGGNKGSGGGYGNTGGGNGGTGKTPGASGGKGAVNGSGTGGAGGMPNGGNGAYGGNKTGDGRDGVKGDAGYVIMSF